MKRAVLLWTKARITVTSDFNWCVPQLPLMPQHLQHVAPSYTRLVHSARVRLLAHSQCPGPFVRTPFLLGSCESSILHLALTHNQSSATS